MSGTTASTSTSTFAGSGKGDSSARRISPRRLLVACLVAAGTLAPVAAMRADDVTPPSVPANLQVPDGQRAYLRVHAAGTQNYVCLPRTSGAGMGWTFQGPQATGFDERDEQVLTHFLSANPSENGFLRPTWQHSRDTSAVWAEPIRNSTDPAYVAPGAVAWLLLETRGVAFGPTGGDRLADTTYIQRVNTSGGSAPANDCAVLGAKLLVPYEADYVFYAAR